MSLKHYGPGSEFPPMKPGTLRIYSMVFCPFAQRVRLVAAAKNIPHEIINITSKIKPEWYVVKGNPLGQVPCIQHDDGRMITDSIIGSEYLDNLYPENRLQPADPYENARQRLLVEYFGKVVTAFYKLARESNEDNLKEMDKVLQALEKDLKDDFIGGDKPAMADYLLWPALERIDFCVAGRGYKYDENKTPKLLAYMDRMKQVPAVKQMLIPADVYVKFFVNYFNEGNPDYDLGIDF